MASHARLNDVGSLVPPAYHQALKDLGIENTAQLYERLLTNRQRRMMALRLRVAPPEILRWVRAIDLLQIENVGEKVVRLMTACGVETIAKLRAADAAQLAARMKDKNRGSRYIESPPSAEMLRHWIAAAKKIPLRLR